MGSKTNQTELWNNILNFDFDKPLSEYGFSTRLADENCWNEHFTRQAILEYKKFMFLAGTSDYMVSPSAIVDIVWHQHLLFSQSYTDFCELIGRTIQHIPSTHNPEDASKFKQARERTRQLYQEQFGEQPETIWNYTDIFDPLNLPKAHYKIRSVIIFALLVFIALSFPLYNFLRPIYITIDNPDFLWAYGGVSACLILCLAEYNRLTFKRIFLSFRDCEFIQNLSTNELIYLESQSLLNVVYVSLDRLIQNGKILVNGSTMKIRINEKIESVEEFTILGLIKSEEKFDYSELIYKLINKPCYSNTAESMLAFKRYFSKSKAFARLYYINLSGLLVILMAGFIRYLTGLSRDKPVILIFICLVAAGSITFYILKKLSNQMFVQTIPQYFKSRGRVERKSETHNADLDYFLLGPAMLSAPLLTLMDVDRRKWKDWGSGTDGGSSCATSGSSCSSDSGSSCSSCGGCGGGGD